MGRTNKRPGMACTNKRGKSGKITPSGTCRKTRNDAGRSRGEGKVSHISKGREVYVSPRGAYYHYSKSGRSKVYHKQDKVY